MPLLLRKITKARWLPVPAWIPKGILHADPLVDLKTIDNRLSVWRVKDDLSNLDQILAALASKCDTASKLDYILFNERLLQEADVRIKRSDGDTFLSEANLAWHHDLVELTARKVVKLFELAIENGRTERVSQKQVVGLVREAVQRGTIDPNYLQPDFRRKIEPP